MTDVIAITAGGQHFRVAAFELCPAASINEWRSLMATAQKQLGGVSSGLTFWGSPAWAIGGAAILGFLERAASTAGAKDGVKTLQQANEKLEYIRKSAKMFPHREIRGVHLPNPAAWVGYADGSESVRMNTIALLDRGKFLRENGLTKSDVVDGSVRLPVKLPYTTLGEDFVGVTLDDGKIVQIRWSSVDAYST